MTESNEGKSKTNLAEGVTFAIASFILATVIGLVLYSWLTKKQEPPIISVTRNEAIREEKGQFYVPFTVANTAAKRQNLCKLLPNCASKAKL